MSRREQSPSITFSALKHAGLALVTLGCFAAGAAGAVHFSASDEAGSPAYRLALFSAEDSAPERAETVEAERNRRTVLAALERAAGPTGAETIDSIEPRRSLYGPTGSLDSSPPSLGVADPGAPRRQAPQADAPVGVRINGRTILPGQSLSEVSARAEGEDDARGVTKIQKLPASQPAASQGGPDEDSAPELANALQTPAPEDISGPTVSIILGGLGINRRHTEAAIEELPAEITLAFAAGSPGLQTWIDRAREDGHEVLIELPMEGFDEGEPLHPNALSPDVSHAVNAARLESFTGAAEDYFGVINDQGGLFAENVSASEKLAAALSQQGLALFEDGSIVHSNFQSAAGAAGLPFASASRVLDSEATGDTIAVELFALEAEARARGHALATASGYPVSIDMLAKWTGSLSSKEVTLVPASYQLSRTRKAPSSQSAQAGSVQAPVEAISLSR